MSLGFYPSCLGYGGFPKSMAISVNEVVCHSIPDSTELVDGDVCAWLAWRHMSDVRLWKCG